MSAFRDHQGFQVFPQVVFHRIGGRLGAVGNAKLRQDAADIISYRALAQEKRLGNFTVGLALRYQQQHVFFLRAEIGKS